MADNRWRPVGGPREFPMWILTAEDGDVLGRVMLVHEVRAEGVVDRWLPYNADNRKLNNGYTLIDDAMCHVEMVYGIPGELAVQPADEALLLGETPGSINGYRILAVVPTGFIKKVVRDGVDRCELERAIIAYSPTDKQWVIARVFGDRPTWWDSGVYFQDEDGARREFPTYLVMWMKKTGWVEQVGG